MKIYPCSEQKERKELEQWLPWEKVKNVEGIYEWSPSNRILVVLGGYDTREPQETARFWCGGKAAWTVHSDEFNAGLFRRLPNAKLCMEVRE